VLLLIPAAASLVLGVVYLFFGDARPAFKVVGVLVFLVAVYLQFVSAHSLLGLLLQVALALCLALWLRLRSAA
jgi:hypothetical protein